MEVVKDIMAARVLKAASMNCDGIESDNVMVRKHHLYAQQLVSGNKAPLVYRREVTHKLSSGMAYSICLLVNAFRRISPRVMKYTCSMNVLFYTVCTPVSEHSVTGPRPNCSYLDCERIIIDLTPGQE